MPFFPKVQTVDQLRSANPRLLRDLNAFRDIPIGRIQKKKAGMRLVKRAHRIGVGVRLLAELMGVTTGTVCLYRRLQGLSKRQLAAKEGAVRYRSNGTYVYHNKQWITLRRYEYIMQHGKEPPTQKIPGQPPMAYTRTNGVIECKQVMPNPKRFLDLARMGRAARKENNRIFHLTNFAMSYYYPVNHEDRVVIRQPFRHVWQLLEALPGQDYASGRAIKTKPELMGYDVIEVGLDGKRKSKLRGRRKTVAA